MIVKSTFSLGEVQPDQRRFVTETHTDEAGADYIYVYTAAVSDDIQAKLEQHANELDSAETN